MITNKETVLEQANQSEDSIMLTNQETVFTLSVREVREERVVTNFEQEEGEALARLTQTCKEK